MNADSDAGALAGLKVVEIAEGVAGPYAGKLLADLGAEVIKIERPRTGDPCRFEPPFYHDEPGPDTGLLFNFLNTSKLGVTLDLQTATGRRLLDGLLVEADVLLAGLSPAEIESFGLGYRRLRAVNPRLVCTFVTPFGLEGPRRDWKGGELISAHLSGLGLSTPRDRLTSGGRPLKPGGRQATMVAGLTSAVATLHALFGREVTGKGQQVDVSEVEPLTSFQFLNLARWTYAGDPGDLGYAEGSRRIWAADGAVSVLLFAGEQRQWDAFKDLVGEPEWFEGEQYRPPISRVPESDPLWARLHAWGGGYQKEKLYREAQSRRIPLFPENTVAEAVDSDQVRSREFMGSMPLASGATVTAPVAPFAMSETAARARGPAPSLGRDNQAVLCGRLGLSREELAEAYAAGIV